MIKGLLQISLSISSQFVLLPVVFGIFSAIVLFIAATIDLVSMISKVMIAFIHLSYPEHLHKFIVSEIIGAVDLYLIAIVLLIFSFGVYELFIYDKKKESSIRLPSILTINSLDELKDKLAKVIVMVLVVSFFQRVLYIKYDGALEMMYFALSIAALSIGVYLLHKDSKYKKIKGVKNNTTQTPTLENK